MQSGILRIQLNVETDTEGSGVVRVNRARQFLELLILLFARVTGCLRLPVYTSRCLHTNSFDYFHLRNVHLVLFRRNMITLHYYDFFYFDWIH